MEKVLALGECGLDKNAETPFDVQKTVFEKQIILSEKYQKPLIIHCVGRFNEILAIKKCVKPTQMWLIHGFRGKPQLAAQLLKADFFLSFGERFNAKAVEITPFERFFVETDESELSIETIYENMAQVKKCEVEKLEKNIIFNSQFSNFN